MNTLRKWSCLFLVGLMTGAATAEEEAKRVVIEGSNTVGEELAPRLIEAFRKDNPDVAFELGTEGTAMGMMALLNNECDIASASRVANEDELRMARARDMRLRSHFIGSYGVSVVMSTDNPVRNLTIPQVRDIFTGEIANWADVGGPDAPIQTYIRDPVSGTYLGFQELAMEFQPYADTAETRLSYKEIEQAVRDDPHGIGYSGMNIKTEGVRAARINGIPANIIAVNEGLYPYARGLRFYTIRGEETAEARAFIRFVRFREGQKILHDMGYVPRLMRLIDPGTPFH